MIGQVTQVTPLMVQPKGATSGQPVAVILAHVDTTGWDTSTRVQISLDDGLLCVIGERVDI